MNNNFPELNSLKNALSSISMDPLPVLDLPMHHMYSDTQFEIIKKHILMFQNGLDSEHEVGLLLTNFGHTTLMNVTQIGYEKSVLMIFKGYVDGREATLIQHINQINFLLTAVPKAEPEQPPRRIGFDTSSLTQ